jgi:hypothetical protein
MRNGNAKLAHVAGAGYMENIRVEVTDHLLHRVQMPPEGQIEVLLLVEGEAESSAAAHHAQT